MTFGHHLMAYVEMFGRDAGRFADARARMNESPLGAAALAGVRDLLTEAVQMMCAQASFEEGAGVDAR